MKSQPAPNQTGFINHLQKKILFTLGFLAIYRVGVHIPIPGVDTIALRSFFSDQGGNLLSMFNMFSGGALERFSVFALGVMPYISASIIAQLLTVVVPRLEALSKEGASGRKKITQYTRYSTIFLAVIQGFLIARTLASSDFGGAPMVPDGGMGWMFMTVLSLVAGTAFVMWLGEQITERGVGNGISLIIFSGIVAGLPSVLANTYAQYNNEQLDLLRIVLIIVICIAVTAGVVFVETGARQVPIRYAKRRVGRVMVAGQQSHLPLRVNASGVIPPIFMSSLLQFPLMVAAFSPESTLAEIINTYMIPGGWLYNTVYVVGVVFFTFFYTRIVFKTDEVAEGLKKNGGFIPGIRPGLRTAEFLDVLVDRLTMAGAIYLSAICVLPTILTGQFNVQFFFGGTSLLIVVGVALETFRQIEAHRQSLRYENFTKSMGQENKRKLPIR